MQNMPAADFYGHKISRLILGGNPFSGNSHISRSMDEEMEDYYTAENIKKAVVRALECGINTIQVRADRHMMRLLRELRNEGHMPMWVAQTAPELLSFEGNIRQLMAYDPVGIYHHGSVTDSLFKEGRYDVIRSRLDVLRKTGKPVGLGTHMPQVIVHAEERNWDVDFYMACVYNLSAADRVSSAVTGIANAGEPFFESDIPIMYETVRSVSKPCLVFKILGATRRCASYESVRSAFAEAFANIKPGDAAVVGMFQRDGDQIKMNADIVREVAR
ncbi:MAG: hypothetical protein PHZ09_00395 [Eubacteriales bacterium]|jgi:hypothetical protein|nr:hypothetical protein [Eubacteriales bacterium]